MTGGKGFGGVRGEWWGEKGRHSETKEERQKEEVRRVTCRGMEVEGVGGLEEGVR